MFDLVHSTQEEGWRPEGAAIATHTNFFSSQREHEGMISPGERIVDTTRARRSDAEDLTAGIRNEEGHQIESGHSTPLIDDLEIEFFEDRSVSGQHHPTAPRTDVCTDHYRQLHTRL